MLAELPPAPFERNVLEADMRRLAAEVTRHREHPERGGEGDRELLRRSIREFKPAAPAAAASGTPFPASPLPDYMQGASAETKLEVEYLLDLALRYGIAKANAAAKEASPFVLDAFHDALTGKLYPELLKRGFVR